MRLKSESLLRGRLIDERCHVVLICLEAGMLSLRLLEKPLLSASRVAHLVWPRSAATTRRNLIYFLLQVTILHIFLSSLTEVIHGTRWYSGRVRDIVDERRHRVHTVQSPALVDRMLILVDEYLLKVLSLTCSKMRLMLLHVIDVAALLRDHLLC